MKSSYYTNQTHLHQRPLLFGKRVIIMLGNLELGGAERQAVFLARYLIHECGVDVRIWGFNTSGPVTKICEEYGIPWRIIQFRWSGNLLSLLYGLIKFTVVLRQVKPDFILPYTMFPNVVCGLTWRWIGAKLCIWNQRDEGRHALSHKIEHWAAKRTPLFISNSEHGADFLTQSLGIKRERIQVIPNGVELPELKVDRLQWRRRLGINDDCFLVCMVANLSIFKDHVTLLKAWQKVCGQLAKNNFPAILLLAGRFDSMYEPLKKLAADLKLGPSIRFLGQVSDISGLLQAIDFGVFSSYLEGCPNAVLEYMAAGLAVVGTDAPGIRDVVGPEGCQFLAPAKDTDALAGQILRLIFERDLRLKTGAANLRRAAEVFSLPRMCEQTVGLLSRGIELKRECSLKAD